MKRLFICTLVTLVGIVAQALAANVEVVAEWTAKPSEAKLEVAIWALKDGAVVGGAFDLAKSTADTDPRCYTLIERKGDKLTKVPVTIVKATARQIVISTAEPVDTKGKYSLIIEKGCLKLAAEHQAVKPYEGMELGVMGDPDKINRLYNGANLTDFEIKQGEKTGAFSVKFVYIRNWRGEKPTTPDEVKDENPMWSGPLESNFHLNLEIDGLVRPKERDAYLNRVELEAGGYSRMMVLNSLTDVGISTKLQADQQFTTIDQTVGVNIWTWANWGWLNKVSDALYLGSAEARPQWQNHPLFIVGYDYVGHYKDEGDEDQDFTGNHRINGRLYWPIPIARGLTLPVFNTKFGIDAVIDVGANWDLTSGAIAPVVNSALEFPIGDGEDTPRISLSYVNGRVAPKFQDFDAFLVGFKVPWGLGPKD